MLRARPPRYFRQRLGLSSRQWRCPIVLTWLNPVPGRIGRPDGATRNTKGGTDRGAALHGPGFSVRSALSHPSRTTVHFGVRGRTTTASVFQVRLRIALPPLAGTWLTQNKKSRDPAQASRSVPLGSRRLLFADCYAIVAPASPSSSPSTDRWHRDSSSQ